MAIVTVGLFERPENRENAWFQIVDDINESNRNTIKELADKATLIMHSSFSKVTTNTTENSSKDSIEDQLVEAVDTIGQKLKYSDTQKNNIKIKFNQWMFNDCKRLVSKINSCESDVFFIYQNNDIKKHEWYFLETLNNIGCNILVITSDLKNFEKVLDIKSFNQINYNTDSKISIESIAANSNIEIKTIESNETSKENKLETLNIEDLTVDETVQALETHNKLISVAICGYSDDFDTNMLAAKISEIAKTDQSIAYLDSEIPKPTIDETSKIYRLTRNDAFYIINTMSNFIKIKDKDLEKKLKDAFIEVMTKLKDNTNGNILYNKATSVVCWINRYIKEIQSEIVFYGKPKGNEIIFFDIIMCANITTCVIISSDKSEAYKGYTTGQSLELEKDRENIPLSMISTSTVQTAAYNASKRLDDTLYSGDAIGLYREGQIKTCSIKHLACTYEEIPLWWNQSMYIRPGFEQNKNSVVIPTIFAVIKGVKDAHENSRQYLAEIQRFACGKTKTYIGNGFGLYLTQCESGPLVHNNADIRNTKFSEQTPLIIKGKLQVTGVKALKNYKYGFLDTYKQELILSKIQEIVDYIVDTKMSVNIGLKESELLDLVLTMCLNLDTDVIRLIQWFNYTEYNPNIIVLSQDENIFHYMDSLYLMFLSKLGFDILVFVPTQYNTIETIVPSTEYEEYIIGRPAYELDIQNIKVTDDEKFVQKSVEKKGFFSRFFSK